MNETLTRALSGFVYITILIVSIYTSQIALAILFLIFATLCLWEFNKLSNINRFTSFINLAAIAFLTYICFTKHTDSCSKSFTIIALLTLITHLLLTYKLFKLQPFSYSVGIFKALLPITYILTPFALLTLIPSSINNSYNPHIIFGILVIIWSNDTFAYLVGRQFGKHKLFEKISPKKTIEGFLGGLIFGTIAAVIIANTTTSLNTLHWFTLSIIIAFSGAIGDLVASKFKREANIKDSSNLIPGHGGFLDRLDSLIFVSSFVYLYLQLLNYVS